MSSALHPAHGDVSVVLNTGMPYPTDKDHAMVAKVTNVETVPIMSGYELTEEERKEFSYIDTSETTSWDDAEFFRYHGTVYDLGEFEACDVKGWDGQHVDSFFSAVLVKLGHDGEEVTAALHFA